MTRDVVLRYLIVAFGGAIGTVLRAALSAWPLPDWLPWTTLFLNVAGCFAIAVVMAIALAYEGSSERWRLFLTTGVLGGFTTFSTYEAGSLTLGYESVPLALGYSAASVVLCLGAVLLGQAATRVVLAWRRSSLPESSAAPSGTD